METSCFLTEVMYLKWNVQNFPSLRFNIHELLSDNILLTLNNLAYVIFVVSFYYFKD